jgi:SLT domain-containing protein
MSRQCAAHSTQPWSKASAELAISWNAACLVQSAAGALALMTSNALRSIRSTGGSGLFNFGSIVGSILGLPGRATGGNVSPGRGYLVGERGPELFVPTSAGRVENTASLGRSREVRVSINVVSPQGASAPQALQRSSRQVASAVRRALTIS